MASIINRLWHTAQTPTWALPTNKYIQYVSFWDPGFNKFWQELNIVPWIGEQTYTEMLFWQFSNIIIYLKIVGKIPDKHLNIWLFSNPGDKDQILGKSTGQICPIILYLFWTFCPGFRNNHTFKCWFAIFPTILTYMIMMENCQNNISVYGFSPIPGIEFILWSQDLRVKNIETKIIYLIFI